MAQGGLGPHGAPWAPWGPWGHGAHGAHGPMGPWARARPGPGPCRLSYVFSKKCAFCQSKKDAERDLEQNGASIARRSLIWTPFVQKNMIHIYI